MDEVEPQFRIRLISELIGLSFEHFDFVIQTLKEPANFSLSLPIPFTYYYFMVMIHRN